MKHLLAIALGFFCTTALALEVTYVIGTSNSVELDGTSRPTFIAGTSGAELCSKEITSTLDSCSKLSSRAACNFKTVCPTTMLRFTMTGKISGEVSLRDFSDYPVYQFGYYEAGTSQTFEVPWSEICFALTSDRTCSVLSRGVLRIGIDSGGSYHSEENSDFIFQVSRLDNNYLDMNTKEKLSLSTSKGIDDYRITPANQSAKVVEFSVLSLFLESYIVGFRAFYEPLSCISLAKNSNAINTSSPSKFLALDKNKQEILDPTIGVLKNGSRYAFMMGLQDDAGNIGYFKDLSHGKCVEDQHTATPSSL